MEWDIRTYEGTKRPLNKTLFFLNVWQKAYNNNNKQQTTSNKQQLPLEPTHRTQSAGHER